MPTKRRFQEISSSAEYLHKSAWYVVDRQLEYAKANPRGALYDDLVAMKFAFHCIEGFLNFVGEKIAPDLWQDEKNQFIGTGIDAKLDAICEQCDLSRPDKGRRPYSTLSALKVLRDAMAHPKIHITESAKAPGWRSCGFASLEDGKLKLDRPWPAETANCRCPNR